MKKKFWKQTTFAIFAFFAMSIIASFCVTSCATGIAYAGSRNGGLMYVGQYTTYGITDGTTLSGSTATNGGGIYVNTGGTLNISGGAIYGNTATSNGNNIYNAGTTNITGGTIANSVEKLTRYDENGNVDPNGSYIYFGSYPQTIKASNVSIDETKYKTLSTGEKYYLGSDNQYYAKLSANPNRSSYVFSDGTTIVSGTDYYFKVEPIKWRILSEDNGQAIILAELILDAHQFYSSQDNRTIDGNTVYANNYKYSDIRSWLNGYSSTYGEDWSGKGFLQRAFTESEQEYIQTTLVDNSASTTDDTSNSACENTNDKVWLLSYQDMINTDYGFNSSYSNYDTMRKKQTSDYSRANHVWYEYQYNGLWWSRSPSSSSYAWYSNIYGNVDFRAVSVASCSVVPALTISIESGSASENGYGIYNTGTLNIYVGSVYDHIYSSGTLNTKVGANVQGTITLADSATIVVEDYAGVTPNYKINLSSTRGEGTIITFKGRTITPDLSKLTVTGYDEERYEILVEEDDDCNLIVFLYPKAYTITFNGNGGSSTTNTLIYGSTLGTLPTSTREGYTFNGWFTATSGGTQITEETIVTGDATYYAQWAINYYYLDLNGVLDGTWGPNIEGYGTADVYISGSRVSAGVTDFYAQYAYGTTYEIKNIVATAGHTYNGVASGSLSGTIGAGTVSVDLSFSTNTYTVTYNPNGGSGSAWSESVTYGTGYTARAVTDSNLKYSRTGYTFAGWNESANGSGSNWTDWIGKAWTWTYTKSITLYAQWTANTYTLTFVGDSGVASISGAGTYTYGTNANVTVIAKTGYVLSYYEGTLYDGSGTGKWTGCSGLSSHTDAWTVNTNRTIYIYSTLINYTLKIDPNGGYRVADGATSVIEVTKTYGATEDISARARSGYTLTGWTLKNTSSGGTTDVGGAKITFDSSAKTGVFTQGSVNCTIVAQWTANIYTINFNGNGGTSTTKTLSYGSALGTLPTSERAGYTFNGWFTATSGGAQISSSTTVTGNVTYYAQWTLEVTEVDGLKYIYFGSYPQTVKASSVTINESNIDSRGYYLGSDGERYAKVTANPRGSTDAYIFSDGTKIVSGTVYYFKVEPIKWRILTQSNGQAIILAENVLTAMWCDDDSSASNNYAQSEIRAFLNGYSTSYGSSYYNNGFYQTAFTSVEQGYIQTTTVDNSASTTDSSSNAYACENTSDKVWLLSYKDAINSNYGFQSSATAQDANKQKKPTDFTMANWAMVSITTHCSYWWLRSPASTNSEYVFNIGTVGAVTSGGVATGKTPGVVPAMTISLGKLTGTTTFSWSFASLENQNSSSENLNNTLNKQDKSSVNQNNFSNEISAFDLCSPVSVCTVGEDFNSNLFAGLKKEYLFDEKRKNILKIQEGKTDVYLFYEKIKSAEYFVFKHKQTGSI